MGVESSLLQPTHVPYKILKYWFFFFVKSNKTAHSTTFFMGELEFSSSSSSR